MLALRTRNGIAASGETLRTARLVLRPLGPGDEAAMLRGAGDYDVARWLAVVPYPYTRAHAKRFLSDVARRAGAIWGIEDAAGLCGVIGIAGGALGYWLDRRAWGRGYLTEAGDAAVDAWFAERRAPALRASYMVENERSRRVLEKLGFCDTGAVAIASAALNQVVPGREMAIDRARWKARRRYRVSVPGLRLRELRNRDLPALARIVDAGPKPWPAGLPPVGADPRRWYEDGRYRGRCGFRASILRRGRVAGSLSLKRRGAHGMPVCAWAFAPQLLDGRLARSAVGVFLADGFARFDLADVAVVLRSGDACGRDLAAVLGFSRSDATPEMVGIELEAGQAVVYRLERSRLEAPS